MSAWEIACCGIPGQARAMVWLPADFIYPTVVAVGDGYHLRPIRVADVDLDYPAVMGSQPRLWSIFGAAWDWPSDSMTYQQDREDLACHEAEIAARQGFSYTLLDDAETALLGCVYIDPPEKQGADAEIAWWVVDGQVGTGLERAGRAGASVDRRRLALYPSALHRPRPVVGGVARVAGHGPGRHAGFPLGKTESHKRARFAGLARHV
jgi:hypothetical protein